MYHSSYNSWHVYYASSVRRKGRPQSLPGHCFVFVSRVILNISKGKYKSCRIQIHTCDVRQLISEVVFRMRLGLWDFYLYSSKQSGISIYHELILTSCLEVAWTKWPRRWRWHLWSRSPQQQWSPWCHQLSRYPVPLWQLRRLQLQAQRLL